MGHLRQPLRHGISTALKAAAGGPSEIDQPEQGSTWT